MPIITFSEAYQLDSFIEACQLSSFVERKMCLKSKHSEENLVTAFQNLKKNSLYCNVTLFCDGHKLKAHRPVLAASSRVFCEMFLAHPCSQPLLILEGVSFKDMSTLVDFMYTGEVNLSETEIDSFLEVAGDLQVKGLTRTPTASTAGPDVQGVVLILPEQQTYKECPRGQGEAGGVDFKVKQEMTSDAEEMESNTDLKNWPLDFINNDFDRYTTVEDNTAKDDQKEMDVYDSVTEAGVRMKKEEVMLMMDQHALTQQEQYKAKAPQDRYEKIYRDPKRLPSFIC